MSWDSEEEDAEMTTRHSNIESLLGRSADGASSEDQGRAALRDALRVGVPVEDDSVIEARRDRLVSVIRSEIEQVPRNLARRDARDRARTVLRWAAAAAALLALVGGAAHLVAEDVPEPTANRSVDGASAALEVPRTSPYVGRLLETGPDEVRNLTFAGRTELRMSAETRFRVAEDGEAAQSFQLGRGTIELTVPQLERERSVRVLTSHATVSVKGTSFSVQVDPGSEGNHSRTRVHVTHGEVLVEHADGKTTLGPGESWASPGPRLGTGSQLTGSKAAHRDAPSTGVSATATAASATADPDRKDVRIESLNSSHLETKGADQLRPDPTTRVEARSPLVDRTSIPDPGQVVSTLPRQNALLEAALRAEKRGNEERARQLVDRLLVEFPESPLRASAQAVKKRLDD